jgi:hypothetical protein
MLSCTGKPVHELVEVTSKIIIAALASCLLFKQTTKSAVPNTIKLLFVFHD